MVDPRNNTGKHLKPTQHDRILQYLAEHDSITVLEAAVKLHITKLPTRISEMRSKGYNFPTNWETSNGSQYLRYHAPV